MIGLRFVKEVGRRGERGNVTGVGLSIGGGLRGDGGRLLWRGGRGS